MARTNHTAPASSQIPASVMGPRILLLLSVLALLVTGFVMLYSASSVEAIHENESSTSYVIRQLAFGAAGILGALVLWKVVPYQVWASNALLIAWVVIILLLIATPIIGDDVLGAKRRLSIGPFSVQPSEFAKIVFVLIMARIVQRIRNGEIDARQVIFECVIYILIPVAILFVTQRDLGTTLICVIGVLAVLWIGEIPLRVILLILGVAAGFALAASFVGFRQDRLIFLNPWVDPEGDGYQLIHSFYAFAEGGLFGVGLGNSREKFQYLPEAETDFIYAIIGEELGLVGAFAVVLLFLLFLYAGLCIVRRSPDPFGAMVAGGCTVMIVFQAFLNIGCVIGILPTTGKPLPFISSGGSSLIACLLMVGLILSVSEGITKPSIHDARRDNLRVVRSTSSPAGSRSRRS